MRADLYLVEAGLIPSRERAKKMIESGRVICDGKLLKKPSEEILPGEHDWIQTSLVARVKIFLV